MNPRLGFTKANTPLLEQCLFQDILCRIKGIYDSVFSLTSASLVAPVLSTASPSEGWLNLVVSHSAFLFLVH